MYFLPGFDISSGSVSRATTNLGEAGWGREPREA